MSRSDDNLGIAELDGLYAAPAEMTQKAIARRLHPHHRAYIERATFFSLATVRDTGLDVSPRGGPPGFVHVLDDTTIAFADWPGNNRIESMRNMVQDSRVALLFLYPGLDIFLRINGSARISADAALLQRTAEGRHMPKTAIVVSIEELIFHCGKAINRAGLWTPQAQLDKREFPSVGAILRDLAEADADQVEALDAHYDESVKTDLY